MSRFMKSTVPSIALPVRPPSPVEVSLFGINPPLCSPLGRLRAACPSRSRFITGRLIFLLFLSSFFAGWDYSPPGILFFLAGGRFVILFGADRALRSDSRLPPMSYPVGASSLFPPSPEDFWLAYLRICSPFRPGKLFPECHLTRPWNFRAPPLSFPPYPSG